jgi:hypothetical protein
MAYPTRYADIIARSCQTSFYRSCGVFLVRRGGVSSERGEYPRLRTMVFHLHLRLLQWQCSGILFPSIGYRHGPLFYFMG